MLGISEALAGGDRGPLPTLRAEVLAPVYCAVRGAAGPDESTPWLGRRVIPTPFEPEFRLVPCSNRPMRFATLWRGRSSGRGLHIYSRIWQQDYGQRIQRKRGERAQTSQSDRRCRGRNCVYGYTWFSSNFAAVWLPDDQ